MPKEECRIIRDAREDKEAQYPLLVVFQAGIPPLPLYFSKTTICTSLV